MGTVLFSSSGAGTFSGSPCTLSGSGNSSSCSVTYTPTVGGTRTHMISADYSSDLNHAPSSGRTTVTENKRATSTTEGLEPRTVGGLATWTHTVRHAHI